MTVTDSMTGGFRTNASTAAAWARVLRHRVVVKVEDPAPQWLGYVLGRLSDLAEQSDDPDLHVNEEALQRALRDLATVLGPEMPAPSVVPTEEDGVQFVWHRGGWDLEIEVRADETIAWARNRNTDAQLYGSLGDLRQQVQAVLLELSAQH